MAWIRRKWTPEAAEEWTREDLIASILSPLAYFVLSLGLLHALLLQTWGYFLLILGVLISYAMYAVIDPKLRTISEEFEKKQSKHLEELESIQRWEE